MNSKKYIVLDIIDRGTFATIFKTLNTITGEYVALKEMMNKNGIGNLLEVDIMSRIKHPNIMRALDIFFSKYASHIIMPLGIPLRNASSINEMEIIRDLISGIIFLHNHNIYHCDIKVDNMIIINETLVIADFGASVASASRRLCQQSLHYSPPEYLYSIISEKEPTFSKEGIYNQKRDAIKSDYWATGICIIYILSRKEAFSLNGKINEEIVSMMMGEYLKDPFPFLKKFVNDFWAEKIYDLMNPIVSQRSIYGFISIIGPLNEGTFEEIRRNPIQGISENLFNKISKWLFLISEIIKLDMRFYLASLDIFLRYYSRYPGIVENLLINVAMTSLFMIQKIFATEYYIPELYALLVNRNLSLSILGKDIEETEISIMYVLNNKFIPYDLLESVDSEEIKNPIYLNKFTSKYLAILLNI